MIKQIGPLFFIFFCHLAMAQPRSYKDSLEAWHQKYIETHEVVKGADRMYLHFFPVNTQYAVIADFKKIEDADWFPMESSGKTKKLYRVYGILEFRIHDTACRLFVYQSRDLMSSAEYSRYLFLPFTDKTSGMESYDNGRYIDIMKEELETGSYKLDFNKAYNPYCAYIIGIYNCPIPPKENELGVAIRAGEIKFSKEHIP